MTAGENRSVSRLSVAWLLVMSAPAVYGQRILHDLVNRPAPPEPKYKVAAEYTEKAAQAGLKGKAVVQVVIDRNGVPQVPKFIAFYDARHPDVALTDPLGLDQTAVAAVRKWRFAPARKNFDTIPAQATIVVDFPGPEKAPLKAPR
jgi:hypothetical protein